MSPIQKSTIIFLYLRQKHALPRGALRLYPLTQRKGGVDNKGDNIKLLETEEDIEKFCYFNKDVFINIFSEDQKKSKVYDMIFLDIDSNDLNKSYMRMFYICDTLTKNGIGYFVVFSGSKGFHVYVPFKPTLLQNYREAIIEWLKDKNISKYVDIQAIESNRVTRVPYSINSKSKKICMILGTDHTRFSLQSILDGSCVDELVMPHNENLGEILREFDRRVKSFSAGKGYEFVIGSESNIFSKFDYYPQCMQILVQEALEGTDLGHLERLEMGKFLLHVFGGNVDKVKSYYKKMSDYNERKTLYNLNYIIRKNLKMLKCDNMKQEGLCPFANQQECPFNPSINHYFSIEREQQRG